MRLLYVNPATGLAAICVAAPKADVEQYAGGPMTEESYMAFVIGRSLPAGVKEVIVLADDWQPPASRHFRNAWKIVDGQLKVCMDTARDIQREHIRAERKPLLEELDRLMARVPPPAPQAAGESNASFQERQRAYHTVLRDIDARKQVLRDAPAHPAIASADDPDTLAALTVVALSQ